jgi:hypothetical protein
VFWIQFGVSLNKMYHYIFKIQWYQKRGAGFFVNKLIFFPQFSSIYFRNVTFYQIPPYLEFSNRVEVLFSQIRTNEGSSKVEPVEFRIKNTNSSRNPVFRLISSIKNLELHKKNINRLGRCFKLILSWFWYQVLFEDNVF